MLMMPDSKMTSQLNELRLCTFLITQITTTSAVPASSCWWRQSSLCCRHCGFVTIYDNLDGCNIGDEGAKQLAKGHWPNLEKLWICNFLIIQLETRPSWMGTVPLPPATGSGWKKLQPASPQIKLAQLLFWVWWLSTGRSHQMWIATLGLTWGKMSKILYRPGSAK